MLSSDALLVMSRFAPILWKGLQNPKHSNGLGSAVANAAVYTGELGSECTLRPDEVAKWEKHFGLTARIREEGSNLYVPLGIGAYGINVRVNMKDVTHQPIAYLEVDEKLKFLIQTHASIGFTGNRPYNAFIAQDIYAQDGQGRWILRQIPGTHGVYGRFCVVETSVWFNLHVDPHQLNLLELGYSNTKGFMLKAELHQKPAHADLCTLTASDDIARANLFFWQLKQMMKPFAMSRLRQPLM